MTVAEVTAILGEPGTEVFFDGDNGNIFLLWSHADGSRISIPFAADKATDKTFSPSTETITDKLRRWLGIQPPVQPVLIPTTVRTISCLGQALPGRVVVP